MRILTLKLLPGLKWSGKLKVEQKRDDGYLVSFDAEDPSSTTERYVYDRTVLSADKLYEWTGWREPV